MMKMSGELRKISCDMGTLSRSDASAIFTSGDTCVIAAVNGPNLSGVKKFSIDEAVVEVNYRPRVGQTTLVDKIFEATLTKVIEVAVLRSQFPRTVINVVVQELDDSGGLLACCINALCLALINSGLPMKFLFASVCCVINQDAQIIVDPSSKEIKGHKAMFTITMEGTGEIISSHINGTYTVEQFNAVVEKSKAAAQEIFKFYKEIIRKYSERLAL